MAIFRRELRKVPLNDRISGNPNQFRLIVNIKRSSSRECCSSIGPSLCRSMTLLCKSTTSLNTLKIEMATSSWYFLTCQERDHLLLGFQKSCRPLHLNEALGPPFSCEKLSLIRSLTKMATHRILETRRNNFERSELGYPHGAIEDPTKRLQYMQTLFHRRSRRRQARYLLWTWRHSAPPVWWTVARINWPVRSPATKLLYRRAPGGTLRPPSLDTAFGLLGSLFQPFQSWYQLAVRLNARQVLTPRFHQAKDLRGLFLDFEVQNREVMIQDRCVFWDVSLTRRLYLIQARAS